MGYAHVNVVKYLVQEAGAEIAPANVDTSRCGYGSNGAGGLEGRGNGLNLALKALEDTEMQLKRDFPETYMEQIQESKRIQNWKEIVGFLEEEMEKTGVNS